MYCQQSLILNVKMIKAQKNTTWLPISLIFFTVKSKIIWIIYKTVSENCVYQKQEKNLKCKDSLC